MTPDEKTKITEIDFHYLKTSSYRSYYFNGIFGGLTPNGSIYMELFLERRPTPIKVKHKIKETGEIGDEIEKDTKKGIIREIECGLIMDINTATRLRDWIDGKIEEYEKIFKDKPIHKNQEGENA
jgi:hypothetical protein